MERLQAIVADIQAQQEALEARIVEAIIVATEIAELRGERQVAQELEQEARKHKAG